MTRIARECLYQGSMMCLGYATFCLHAANKTGRTEIHSFSHRRQLCSFVCTFHPYSIRPSKLTLWHCRNIDPWIV